MTARKDTMAGKSSRTLQFGRSVVGARSKDVLPAARLTREPIELGDYAVLFSPQAILRRRTEPASAPTFTQPSAARARGLLHTR